MWIKKIGEFYYDNNVKNLLFLLSEMDVQGKLNFLQGCRKSYSMLTGNITAIRLVQTIEMVSTTNKLLAGVKSSHFFL